MDVLLIYEIDVFDVAVIALEDLNVVFLDSLGLI